MNESIVSESLRIINGKIQEYIRTHSEWRVKNSKYNTFDYPFMYGKINICDIIKYDMEYDIKSVISSTLANVMEQCGYIIIDIVPEEFPDIYEDCVKINTHNQLYQEELEKKLEELNETVDYKSLLTKYINHVAHCEGTTFLTFPSDLQEHERIFLGNLEN